MERGTGQIRIVEVVGSDNEGFGLLRLAAPLESLLGLGLLTASVSWLLRAIDDFAASIVGRFRVPGGGSTREVLEAYARDHAV